MPLSFQQHTANGSTTVFDASQIDGYLSTGHIYVFVNDVQKTAGVHYNLQTSPSLQVTFTAGNTPAFKDEVRIQRLTPNTVAGRAVDFADGSVLNANDLDQSALQLLYITQEAEDLGSGALGKQFDQLSWNAENLPITSAVTGGGADSLTTKGYVDNLALYGGGAVNPQAWTFSGDGAIDTFTLSPVANATNPAMFIVEVGGTILRPTTDYTIPADSQIVFATPPALGTDNIIVRNLGVSRNLNESVSTAMIQNGAVTSAKLDSSLAVTTSLNVGGLTVGRAGADTNAVLGKGAASSISSGGNNVVIGNNAGAGVDTGNLNICIGSGANTSSGTSDAVAIGRNARAGTACLAIGNYALLAGASSSDNVAAGHSAIVNCTGSSNVAVGAYSGATLTTGIQNVLIGRSANVQAAGNSNSIVIGASATGAGTNTTVIGNSSTTNTIIPAGALTVSSGNLAVSSGNLAVSAGNLTVSGQATFGSVGQSLINKQFSDSPVSGASVSAAFPTWVRRVMVSFMSVSASGTSPWILQVMRAGVAETSGYKSRSLYHGVGWAANNNAFSLNTGTTAANFYTGTYVLDRVDTGGTIWCLSGQLVDDAANALWNSSGHYAGGSTPITGIRVLLATSPQVWDAGRIAISWE